MVGRSVADRLKAKEARSAKTSNVVHRHLLPEALKKWALRYWNAQSQRGKLAA
jgi:hypothetical protein